MKRGAMIIVSAMALALHAGEGNLLKNGDFEKFSGNDPTGWISGNIPNVLTVVSPSSRSASGKTSVKCEVKDFYGTKMGGTLSQKDIAVNRGELHVKGFYLLKSVGKDAGYISVDVKTEENSTIGTCERYLAEATGEFVPFSFSTKLPDGAKRVDIMLTLMADKNSESLHEGSYVLFDGLELVVLGGDGKQVP